MFISSHEIEHSFSNEAQRLVYRRLRRRTKRRLRDTRSVPDLHLVHSSALISSSLLPLLSQLSKIIILVPLTFFLAHTVNYAQRWWHLTMTNFYRRSSNCQLHHTVQISVVSTTVLPPFHSTCPGEFFLRVLIRCLFSHFSVRSSILCTSWRGRRILFRSFFAVSKCLKHRLILKSKVWWVDQLINSGWNQIKRLFGTVLP